MDRLKEFIEQKCISFSTEKKGDLLVTLSLASFYYEMLEDGQKETLNLSKNYKYILKKMEVVLRFEQVFWKYFDEYINEFTELRFKDVSFLKFLVYKELNVSHISIWNICKKFLEYLSR